jgi:hypothetical protein
MRHIHSLANFTFSRYLQAKHITHTDLTHCLSINLYDSDANDTHTHTQGLGHLITLQSLVKHLTKNSHVSSWPWARSLHSCSKPTSVATPVQPSDKDLLLWICSACLLQPFRRVASSDFSLTTAVHYKFLTPPMALSALPHTTFYEGNSSGWKVQGLKLA